MELQDYEQRVGKSRHIEVKIYCEYCGVEKWVKWTRVKKGQGRFCSLQCAGHAQSLGDERLYVGKKNGKSSLNKSAQRYTVYWFDPETLERKTTSYARWWWEVNKGEIPEGYRASYKDGNQMNISPDNITLVSPEEFGQAISSRLMGHTFSEETLQKMSEARNGITLSDEHKKKISDSLYKRWQSGEFNSIHVGENNSHWRGGVEKVYDKEYSKIRPFILGRDKHKCRICGNKSKRMEVHHINGNKSDNSEENLISLCYLCHHKIHDYKGTEGSKDPIILAFRSKLGS